ncbi:MAG: tRNA uridine-5-carboxymethylaminomethyl(34) synthesis GTPase MnmE [Gammaproteobacteria bacterium]|nr:tRNA uridine-5-carboxymethylaminomethyl(34) synthesis GTPase MnmE [Gammaproteobacteria bacterium]
MVHHQQAAGEELSAAPSANRSADTIAAIATPPGIGGIGIVRVSGPDAAEVCRALTGSCPPPRMARFGTFRGADGAAVDHGITLYFPRPASYTGEDVVEFEGHGGDTVMEILLEEACRAGARPARPGEFSERAFLNGRMDLAQAEAVADLIESASREAARLAMRSLEGVFSTRVAGCAEALMAIRLYVEAAIDFPEEEIDFLAESDVAARLDDARALVAGTLEESRRGALVRRGLDVVLAGAPNAGKSSLLNALAGRQRAIVSATPGTTRDTVDERVRIGGVTVNLVDTAGLREAAEEIEREGIRRAREAAAAADLVLAVCDDADGDEAADALIASLAPGPATLVVHNKIDLTDAAPGDHGRPGHLWVSALTGAGIEALEHALMAHARRGGGENVFLARRRHVDALERALAALDEAVAETRLGNGELVAESLRLAHDALGEITGAVTSDDLLGAIFGSFCIGK